MPAKRSKLVPKVATKKRATAGKHGVVKRKGVAAKAAPRKKAAPRRASRPADMVTVHCSRCGMPGETVRGGVPAGWSVGFSGGRLEYLCVGCARANIRAIEGKLPEEWWE